MNLPPLGSGPDADRGVYGISVAAELVGTGAQNLRLYETRGLLEPDRTAGGTRRYSANDLDRLRRIGELLEAGLNLAGIAMVLDLEDQNAQLRAEMQGKQWLSTAPTRSRRSPEADLLDQQTPTQAEALGDDPAATITPAVRADVADAVNEADLLEQLVPQTQLHPDEDDDYPHDPPHSGGRDA